MKSTLYGLLALVALLAAASGCGRPEVRSYDALDEKVEEIRALLAKSAPAEATSAQNETTVKATGWATLKGRFVYEGDPPKPSPLNINKDQDVCGKHPLVDESLKVGSDRGLENVVIFVRNRKVEVNPEYAADANKPVVLDNNGCRFEPHVLTMRTTQPLMVKNSDPVGHNTNADLKSNAPFNVIVSANTDAEQKIGSAEAMPATVTCNIHPWMKAYMLVQPHPYMAVSSKDGSFEIKNLPAGVPLDFQLWHEASTGSNHALEIQSGDLKTPANGRVTLTLKPDEIRDLKDVNVPAAELAGG
ncbi:MAG: hypothetical protein IT427_08820 [Pirellulales bacterium]|nr:hypothetical protein [Pirellulales bacterium]